MSKSAVAFEVGLRQQGTGLRAATEITRGYEAGRELETRHLLGAGGALPLVKTLCTCAAYKGKPVHVCD